MADQEIGGAASISPTGIWLTGGPTTYTKSLQATALTVSGTANFGPVQASVVNSTSLLGNSLSIPYAMAASSTALAVTAPTTVTTLTGGTGSFQSLTVAGSSVVGSQTVSGSSVFSANLSVGGSVLSSDLWGGVTTLATSLAVPQYGMGSWYSGNQQVYHLGA